MKTFKISSSFFIFAVGLLIFDTANCSEDVSQHKNIGLLKEPCGLTEKYGTRTTVEPPLFEFRWMALIAYDGVRKGMPYSCQGTLINDRYVLTTAHCISNLPKTYKPVSVRLGEHDLKSNPDCQESLLGEANEKRCAPEPLNIDIEEIIVNPNYSPRGHRSAEHDIALLRLARPVVSDYVSPICLPIGLPKQTKTFEKEQLNLVGWNKKLSDLSIPKRLQVPVIGYDRCAAAMKDRLTISAESNICVGGRDAESTFCPLSGSALSYLADSSDGHGRYELVAVGSVGDSSCKTDVIPDVYTRVGNYMEWILDSMKA